MTSDSTIALTSLLNALAARARERSEDKVDLSPATGIVNDLGRFITLGAESDLRALQGSVAAVREQLDVGEHAVNTPERALQGRDAHGYLAGALWAINEIMTIRLQAIASQSDPSADASRTRRSAIRSATLISFLTTPVQTPTGIVGELSKRHSDDTRLDEVSRVLGELLKEGLVEPATPASGADRRLRHFALTAAGRAAAESEGVSLLTRSGSRT